MSTQDQSLPVGPFEALDAMAREKAWCAWCGPLAAAVGDIWMFLDANPVTNQGDWNRPGVYISSPYGARYHLNIRLTEHAPLSIGLDRAKGTYLYRHIPRFDAQGRRCGATEARVYLDQPWSGQDSIVHGSWPDSWRDVQDVLGALAVSLRMGTPLGSTAPWEQTLKEHLLHQHKNEINPHEWKTWTHRWGTPAMEAAVDVVNSLFDPNADTLMWREQVLASWQSPQGPALQDVSDDLFCVPSQEA